MSAEQGYNGWTNYETWVVKLWMDNDSSSVDYWRGQARDALSVAAKGGFRNEYTPGRITNDELAVTAFAEQLKDEHGAALPEGNAFWVDLLGAAMSEVSWREIAKNLLDTEREEARGGR